MSQRYRVEHIIDRESGEILDRKVVDLFDRWDPVKGWKFYHGRSTIETAKRIPYPDALTDAELGRLQRLSKYTVGDSGILAYRGNGEQQRPVTVEVIATIFKISPRSAYRFLSRMKEIRMLAEMTLDGDIWLCMNPLHWGTSDWIPFSLYICFRDEIDAYLPESAKSRYRAAELGDT